MMTSSERELLACLAHMMEERAVSALKVAERTGDILIMEDAKAKLQRLQLRMAAAAVE